MPVFWSEPLDAKLIILMNVVLGVSLAGCSTTHQASLRSTDAGKLTAAHTTSTESEMSPGSDAAQKDAAVRLVTHRVVEDPATQSLADVFALQAELVGPVASERLVDELPSMGESVGVESLVAMALESNPSIQQAQAALCQARGIHVQVGLKPNPSVGYFAQEVGNEGSAGQHGVFVAQTFVRGDKLARNRDVTSRDVQRLHWMLMTQRQRVETDVRTRFYQALTTQKKLERARVFREEAVRASDIAKQRLDAEEGTRPDLLQSQILVDEVDLSIESAELEWKAVWEQLAAAVAAPGLQPELLSGEFPNQLPVDQDSLFQRISAESPLLQAAQSRVDRARSNVNRQRQQAIPNVNAQLGTGFDDSTGDAFANLQLGLPLPIHNRNQGNICAANAEYNAAIQNIERLRLLLRQEIAEAVRRHETASARVLKFRDSMLPRAKESLKLVQHAQAAGEVEFLRVLTARQMYFELTQKLIAARGELAQVGAEIDGMLLMDSLSSVENYQGDDGLRGQSLSGQ